MGKQSYQIIMQTPLGARYGTMSVTLADQTVSGTMEILKHMEPFSGTIDENGDCRITGRMVTLMRSIDFTAEGNITPESVHLTVQGGRNSFELHGKCISKKKEEEQE